MQENNSFETIISTWRRLSGEQVETAVVSMSGDQSETLPHKKKEEEVDLLMTDKSKAQIVPASSTLGTVDSLADSTGIGDKEEKKGFIQYDKEDSKDASGDSDEKAFKDDKNDDYLENKPSDKSNNEEKERLGDKVDGVYIPPQKTKSITTTEEEEGCGIKCLYYTLQCCDCVLM